MEKNSAELELIMKCTIGRSVAIPHTIFPNEPEPPGFFWMGKIVETPLGGTGDVGIKVEGERVFTRPRSEVVNWLIPEGA